MKKFSKYIYILLSVLMTVGIASCGNDEPDSTMEANMIYPSAESKRNITIGYDHTATLSVIEFTATGDWTAEIYPADSNFEIAADSKSYSKVDWLDVNPYAGSAGNWSCDLLTSPNRMAHSRYAVVILNSYKNSVRFNVTQEGMPNGGGGTIIPNPDN